MLQLTARVTCRSNAACPVIGVNYFGRGGSLAVAELIKHHQNEQVVALVAA